MKASLKHIIINKVGILKKGYVIKIDGLFGTITEVGAENSTVKFTDESVKTYTTEELKYCVVKFLAVMKDLNTFPVSHGDFYKIIYFFDTPEKVEKFVGNVVNTTAEGDLVTILSYPKEEDVVELISLKKAEENNLLKDKADRIGIITKIKKPRDGTFVVKFPTKTINLKRTDFNVLNGVNSKQIFKIKD